MMRFNVGVPSGERINALGGPPPDQDIARLLRLQDQRDQRGSLLATGEEASCTL
jgi:hypothetical protein